MNYNSRLLPSIAAVMAVVTIACGSPATPADDIGDTPQEVIDSLVECSADLRLYELKGHVKDCTRKSFFNVVTTADGSFTVDSTGRDTLVATAHFDIRGTYLPKKHERVRRDSAGRIVRWEDRRANVDNIPGGFLKDTIEYRYIDDNHLISDGMGQYAVIVYDNDRKVVGQYTVPRFNRVNTSAFNVYKAFDENGNWTERLTIWSTQGVNDSLPHVSYSIDRRIITYYK